MPIIRTSASDRTAFLRVNATSVAPVAPNLRRPASYSYAPRNVIPPITRASEAAKGASPGNSVLGTPVAPAPVPNCAGPLGGSLSFDKFYNLSGNPVGSWVRVSQNSPTSLSPGTGDFTIEWWQYLSTNPYGEFPRVFTLGDDVLEVSLEGLAGVRTLYVWINGNATDLGLFTVDNSWWHFAIVRKNGVVTVYLNGTALGPFSNSENISTPDDLFIGAFSNVGVDAGELFEGYITNFRWVVGNAVYTSEFTPPVCDLSVVPGTKLLLRANSSGTALDNAAGSGFVTIYNTGVTWDATIPTD